MAEAEAGQAAEPVFSITDEPVLLNFRSVFRKRLNDPALLNSIMLTFSFAMTGVLEKECLTYHSQALNAIRRKLDSPEETVSEATLAAIVLLAGIEVRLNMPFQAQLHMNAVQQLLNLCQKQGIYLNDGIKRAIFWQDLNSSVMIGTKRIVDHTTFAELRWRRDPFTPNAFSLPSGFLKVTHLLTDEFVEVLRDLHALQRIRDFAKISFDDVTWILQVDNHQASIQSRLASSPEISPFFDCCRLAAYLCSTTLRCKVWPASVIPGQLSMKLLRKLQQGGENIWDAYPDVLVWLLCLGGTFAQEGNIRSEYLMLLRSNQKFRFEGQYGSWSELLDVLKQFVWSEKAFEPQVKAFWEGIFAEDSS